jgi:hypothetical protein
MWTFFYPPTYRILRRGYTKGLVVAFTVRMNIETRPDAVIGAGTPGGAYRADVRHSIPRAASGIQADRVTGFQGAVTDRLHSRRWMPVRRHRKVSVNVATF